MFYVGIDIAKLNHLASAISSDGTELMKLFKFSNDGDGLQMLVSRLVELSFVDDTIKTSVMRKDNIRVTGCLCRSGSFRVPIR